MAPDLTIEILREIRDGVLDLRRYLNSQISELREDFNAGLDQTNSRLERVVHGPDDPGKFMRSIAVDQAHHERFHAHQVERLESDMVAIKTRVERLEHPVDPSGTTKS